MPRLSVLIPPPQASESGLANLVGVLLADTSLDLEIITPEHDALSAIEDPRLRLLPAMPAGTPQQTIWSALVEASAGEWVTLVKPDDMLEPELAIMVGFVAEANPVADALSWHTLQIDATDPPDRRFSVGVPSQYAIVNIDKTVMLKAFFMWENSLNVPRMPFGLFHGALKRPLALSIVESLAASGRVSLLPAAEWSARTIFMANEIAFCERPMSVIARQGFAFDPAGQPTPDFPFHAGIGETAGIAEVQNAVFMEMGAPWGPGAEEAFLRAATIDCLLEIDEETFAAKCEAYDKAFRSWDGGRHAHLFQPYYAGPQQPDIRRGLHGNMLMVDRFIGRARTAQDFYRVMRSFLAPVRLICGAGAAI
ncbi:hypothetical protein [Rhizobium sp. C4]|uniref:hypothetical protein n=1 Tax=Rhizobium sp. C4 TaxID=1349800 RepID=UPI001E5CD118|nr:hypothetical protein [Rhizobium sp. C4]MCD2174636.1 hypothetical protein [Rhizobium sp. C4]